MHRAPKVSLCIDTDLLRDLKQLRAELAERCEPNKQGCQLFPVAAIKARLSGYHERKGISPARVAWALAHPSDHLGPHDLAVHTCAFGTNHGDGEGDPRVCCEPSHLIKGSVTEVVIMQRARKLSRRPA